MAEAGGYIFDANARRRIAAAVRRIEAIPPGRPVPTLGGDPGDRRDFWAKVADDRDELSANRWAYGWAEHWRTATGFELLPGGRSGTPTTDPAINAAEAFNAGSGIMGNGVDHSADYPTGFSLKPIRGGRVVRMHVDYLADGTAVYTFEASNAEQGACPDTPPGGGGGGGESPGAAVPFTFTGPAGAVPFGYLSGGPGAPPGGGGGGGGGASPMPFSLIGPDGALPFNYTGP